MFALTHFLLTKKKMNVFSVVVLFGSEVCISEFSGRCSAQAGVAAQGSDQTAGPPRGVPSSCGLSLDSGCTAAAPWKCWGLCWSTWGGEDVPETKGGTRLFLGSSHRVQPSGQGDSPHLSDIDGTKPSRAHT